MFRPSDIQNSSLKVMMIMNKVMRQQDDKNTKQKYGNTTKRIKILNKESNNTKLTLGLVWFVLLNDT